MKCNNLKQGRVITHSKCSKTVLVALIGIVFVEIQWFSLGALAYLSREQLCKSLASTPKINEM
jgi:uncharacterized protein YneF (UPF0154 family)